MAINFTLRYTTEKQKKGLEDLAKENNRSANSHILHLIDMAVLSNNEKGDRVGLIKKYKKENNDKNH